MQAARVQEIQLATANWLLYCEEEEQKRSMVLVL